jgi:hypothetical protein
MEAELSDATQIWKFSFQPHNNGPADYHRTFLLRLDMIRPLPARRRQGASR